MGSYSAFFIAGNDLASARAALGTAAEVPGAAWVIAGLYEGASPPADAMLEGRSSYTEALSRKLGDVVFLFADSSTAAFVYEHAKDGALIRKLVWFPMLGDDWSLGWICAEGEPEAWESALFTPDGLERSLRRAPGEEDAGAGEAEIRAAWEAHRITAGKAYPGCDATVARVVERSLGVVRG